MIVQPVIALCVGHSRLGPNGKPEGGAWTHDGATSEWTFNHDMAHRVCVWLDQHHGLRATIIDFYQGKSYGAAMRWLGELIKNQAGGCTVKLAVELHFNSSDNPRAEGHEWLYWHGSLRGYSAAAAMSTEMGKLFPELVARGPKKIVRGDDGAGFLRMMPCTAVIAEPFFGSSPADWRKVRAREAGFAAALADGIAAGYKAAVLAGI